MAIARTAKFDYLCAETSVSSDRFRPNQRIFVLMAVGSIRQSELACTSSIMAINGWIAPIAGKMDGVQKNRKSCRHKASLKGNDTQDDTENGT